MTNSVSVVPGKRRLMTLLVEGNTPKYLHSQYDPVSEAKTIVDAWKIQDTDNQIFVVGLGLGYHVRECLSRYSGLDRVIVIECNPDIVKVAQTFDVELFSNPKVQVICPGGEDELRNLFLSCNPEQIKLHPASVDCLPYSDIRALLQEMQMVTVSANRNAEQLLRNLNENLPFLTPDLILSGKSGMYRGNPGIILSGGPSFNTSLPFLAELMKANAVTLAVTRVLPKLMQHGVVPTGVVATESHEWLMYHFDGIPDKVELPPLYAIPTVHPQIVNSYKHSTTWVLHEGFAELELLAKEKGFDIFPTGGSVATLALSLLYYFGCNPIVFVGQDLAYVGGESHANHSGIKLNNSDASFHVEIDSVHHEKMYTTLSWNSFRHWIEGFIEAHADRTYINASEGADIRGTMYVPIQNVRQVLLSEG